MYTKDLAISMCMPKLSSCTNTLLKFRANTCNMSKGSSRISNLYISYIHWNVYKGTCMLPERIVFTSFSISEDCFNLFILVFKLAQLCSL